MLHSRKTFSTRSVITLVSKYSKGTEGPTLWDEVAEGLKNDNGRFRCERYLADQLPLAADIRCDLYNSMNLPLLIVMFVEQ